MRILLTGATGFVGGEVLSQLIADERVSGVTCISRRAPSLTHPKVNVVLRDDFEHYDAAFLQTIANHQACIWALGGKASDFATQALYERVTYTFTVAFATAMAQHTVGPFAFVYVSGMGADPAETSRMPWQKVTRHLKGRTERALLSLCTDYPQLTVTCFRPGGILPRQSHALVHLLLKLWVIGVDRLAKALVATALTQPTRPSVVEKRIHRSCGPGLSQVSKFGLQNAIVGVLLPHTQRTVFMSKNLSCPTLPDIMAAIAQMVGEQSASRIWTEACRASNVVAEQPISTTQLQTVLNYIVTTRGLAGVAARSQLVRLKSFMALNS